MKRATPKKLAVQAMIAIFSCLTLFTVMFAQKGKPTPSPKPTPTPTPGCATAAANTNFWVGTGGLDTSFGIGGITSFTAGLPGTEGVHRVLVQTDGKIVTVGYGRNPAGLTGASDMQVIRFNQDGSVDNSFGTPDPANNGLRLGYIFVDFSLGLDNFAGGVLDSSDRILIASWYNAKIARLDTNGDLDPTFGTGGKIETPIPNLTPSNMVILSTGKIVLTGGATMARFNEDGSLDTTFGTNGSGSITITGANGSGININSVSTQSISGEERLILAGSATADRRANPTFALMRFRPDGQVDTSFGNNGLTTTSVFGIRDQIMDHTIDASNRIVAVGQANTPCGMDAGFARYTENGVLDTSFSGDGRFTQDIYGGNNVMRTVIIQNGKILAGGFAIDADGSDYDMAMTRLDQDGTPDASFGPGNVLGNGIVTTDITGNVNSGMRLALDLNGNILFGGHGSNNGSVVARYVP